MSTTVLVLLYAYRTVTVVLRLVDFVRVILVTEYIRTTVSNELGGGYTYDTRRLTRLSVSNRIKTMYDWLIIYLVT